MPAIAYDSLLSTIVSHLATCTGQRVEPADEDTLTALAASDAKIDTRWFYKPVSIVPSIDDVNSNRLKLTLELAVVFSSTADAKQNGRMFKISARACRLIQTTGFPVGVDLIDITGDVTIDQRFGLTVIAIPLAVSAWVEEA